MHTDTWAFALHGGAGAVAGRDYTETESHLAKLAEACRHKLDRGGRALNVVEFAVHELETCGLYVAGRGSAPNSAGYVELDASIMDGATRAAGAVAALRDFVSPIGVARAVMEKTPHVMLAGEGARRFAVDMGFPEEDLLTDEARQAWQRSLDHTVTPWATRSAYSESFSGSL